MEFVGGDGAGAFGGRGRSHCCCCYRLCFKRSVGVRTIEVRDSLCRVIGSGYSGMSFRLVY